MTEADSLPELVALDSSVAMSARLSAIRELGQTNSSSAVEVLLTLAERADESSNILMASGHALASLLATGQKVTEFDMRDMHKKAFDALCEGE